MKVPAVQKNVGTAGRWYLSGPMSGLDDNNFPAFDSAVKELRRQGLSVFSPHEQPVNEVDGTWADFLRADIDVLVMCDGIVLLKGWSKSKGAQLELHIALALGFQVRLFNESTGELFDAN